jgi:hypothetical protein
MATTRTYYAIEHVYGICCDDRGNRIGTHHRFGTRAARDAWVADGQPYRTNPGYREEIPASDRELRRLLRSIDAELIEQHP